MSPETSGWNALVWLQTGAGPVSLLGCSRSPISKRQIVLVKSHAYMRTVFSRQRLLKSLNKLTHVLVGC